MPVTSWAFPGAVSGSGWAASDAGTLVHALSADDDIVAQINPATSFLIAGDFGFALPAGALPEGIEVYCQCFYWPNPILITFPATYPYIGLWVSKDGATPATTERERITFGPHPLTPPATSPAFTEGSAADLWSLAWTDAEINSPNFSVLIKQGTSSAETPGQGRAVDFVQVRVHYSEPVVTDPTSILASKHRRIPEFGAKNSGPGVRKS